MPGGIVKGVRSASPKRKSRQHLRFERAMGIDPGLSAWEAASRTRPFTQRIGCPSPPGTGPALREIFAAVQGEARSPRQPAIARIEAYLEQHRDRLVDVNKMTEAVPF